MIKISDEPKTKQVFLQCDKCGAKKKSTVTRTYPFIFGYRNLCFKCYEKLEIIILRFFKEVKK